MKITKKELQRAIRRQESRIDGLVGLLAKKGYYDKEPEPQLKQLDQSVFDGLDEKWRFAAVDKCGEVWYSTHKTQPSISGTHLSPEPNADSMQAKGYYDTSNWQNSLIERDTAKELTGSDYYYSKSVTERLENGQELVMCFVSNVSESDAMQERHVEVITSVDTEFNDTDGYGWQYAILINNQGEPLTASEVGL